MPNAGAVEVEVVADASQFDDDLNRRIKRSLKGAERAAGEGGKRFGNRLTAGMKGAVRSLTSLPALIAGGLAGGAVVGGLKSVISAASDLSEETSKVDTVFGKAAAAVQSFAKGSADSLGISRVAALEAAGVYGNLFVAMGITGEKSAEMSTRLVTLAADMASFNNASPEETLNALRSGLAGETEPLKRFGVLLNQATIAQEAFDTGLIKSTKQALTPAQKAQAAYSLILKQTSVAQGDVDRTAGGLANTQRRLAAKVSDLKARLGSALLPVALKVAGALERMLDGSGPLVPFFRDMSVHVQAFVRGFRGGSKEAGNVENSLTKLGITIRERVIPAVIAFATGLVAFVKTGWDVFGPVIVDGIRLLGDMAGYVAENSTLFTTLTAAVIGGVVAYKAFMVVLKVANTLKAMVAIYRAVTAGQIALNVAMIANPIGLVVAAIAALAVGLVIAYKKSDRFRAVVNGAFKVVGKMALTVIDGILSGFEKMFGVLGKLPGKFGEPFRKAEASVKAARVGVETLQTRLDRLGRTKAGPSIVLMGVGAAEEALVRLEKRVTMIGSTTVRLPVPKPGSLTGGGGRGVVAAEGGIVRRPTFLLAGEAGPEAIVPLDKTRGNGPLPGGTTVEQHFHVSGPVDHDALMRQAAFRFRTSAAV